jgi:drug/metabolite transporter (DMT)-like permease
MVLGHGVFQGCIALTLSMWLFGKMVIAFGPVRTTMITALAPPMAALVAVPVLDEPLTWFVVAGLLCVVVGTVVGVRPARAP